jgi:hypothetical protein
MILTIYTEEFIRIRNNFFLLNKKHALSEPGYPIARQATTGSSSDAPPSAYHVSIRHGTSTTGTEPAPPANRPVGRASECSLVSELRRPGAQAVTSHS